jgi:hypothetical protein
MGAPPTTGALRDGRRRTIVRQTPHVAVCDNVRVSRVKSGPGRSLRVLDAGFLSRRSHRSGSSLLECLGRGIAAIEEDGGRAGHGEQPRPDQGSPGH